MDCSNSAFAMRLASASCSNQSDLFHGIGFFAVTFVASSNRCGNFLIISANQALSFERLAVRRATSRAKILDCENTSDSRTDTLLKTSRSDEMVEAPEPEIVTSHLNGSSNVRISLPPSRVNSGKIQGLFCAH